MASCPRLHPTTALQAGCFPLRRRRLESDAERCCGRDRCHSGGFLLRIMPPSWHPVPACTPRLHCRRAVLLCSNENQSRMQAVVAVRRLRQGRCHDCAAGGQFSIATTIMLQRFASLGLKSRIGARKRLFSGKSLHRFPSLALKSRIDARRRA